jgi:hypothetical protein
MGAIAGATPPSGGGHTWGPRAQHARSQGLTVRMDNSIRLRYIGPASQRFCLSSKPYGTTRVRIRLVSTFFHT